MSKVNFSELKRNKIYKTFISDNGSEIQVYNPSPDQRKLIADLLSKGINEETQEVSISQKDMLLELIPMLTNLHFDIDEDMVDDVLEDPSETLIQVNSTISEIVLTIFNNTFKNVKFMNTLEPIFQEGILNSLSTDEKSE